MSRLTVWAIHLNNVLAGAGQCEGSGKWTGCIMHDQTRNYRILVSTACVYDTEQAALDAMNETIQKIKALTIEELTK